MKTRHHFMVAYFKHLRMEQNVCTLPSLPGMRMERYTRALGEPTVAHGNS
jgi:hypothetical protein